MEQVKFSSFLLFSFCLLLFSCGKKSGIETQQVGDDSQLDSITAINNKSEKISSWAIDANASAIKFTIKNMGTTVDGTLGGLKGSIFFDDKNLKESKFETAVEVNTINTGIEKRDNDLMAEKFFDQKKFPQIIFRSDSIVKTGNNYEVDGNFIIKGISQHRKIPFTFQQSGNMGIFKSNFTINRLDFNVGGNGPIMGTEVNVSIEVMTKKME
jgi:polyisoprenoid-binding protein YceI